MGNGTLNTTIRLLGAQMTFPLPRNVEKSESSKCHFGILCILSNKYIQNHYRGHFRRSQCKLALKQTPCRCENLPTMKDKCFVSH